MSYAKKKWMDAQNAKKQNKQSGTLARAAGGTSTIEGVDNIPEQNQTSVVYDLLSEGPIEGLVDGTNSIYLEKTPVTSSDTTHQPVRIVNATFTASSGTVVDSDSGNLLNGLSTTDGRRYVRIPGGKKVRTGNGSSVGISGTEGSTIITADSSFFATDDLTEIDPSASSNVEIDPSIPRPYIRIAGAGDNSNVDLVTPIIRFISATSVEIGQPLPRTIAHKTASIDKIATINTISDANTFTISNISQVGTASRDVSSVEVHVSSPQIGVEDVTYNYQNFQYAFFNGLPNQPYLPGYRGIGSSTIIDNPNRAIEQTAGIFASNDNNTTGGWHETKTPDATAQPVIITDASVSNPNDIDSIKLTFKSPSMIATKPSSGDEKPAEAELRIFLEYKKTGDGAFTRRQIFGPTQSELDARDSNRKTRTWEHPHNSGKIRSRTKSPFAESFVINLAQYKPLTNYQIRIERTNPSQGKNGNYEHNSPLTLDTVEHRFADKLSYPHAAYAALIFDAETFSKIPTRGYEIKGLKVKVPTNYFPKGEGGRTSGQYDRNVTTGADAGSYQKWDGNFRGDTDVFSAGNANYELVWTDNPAWIFYDLVTNKRYGIGKYIDASQIDKYELYKIARYCDELVSDGKGGTEPRFSANVYIKESADALKVLKDITQVFRGMLYWLNGEIQFSQNRYQQPVYTFSKANVIDKFKYTSTASEFRSNQVRVTWNDPESMYKKQVEIVEDTNNILETGKIVTKDVLAFGCTSRGQAHRFGKWTLFTEILENEVVSFQTSINAGFLKPGDVVLLQDADRDVISNSGRVTNFNPESGLTLDLTAGSGGSATTINGNGTDSGGFPFYTTAQQGANVVFAGEVNLPSSFSQDACMWEHGGTGVGSWLGVRDIGGTYNLTLRSGEGIESVTATSADGIVTNIPISDIPEFDDQVHTVCWEFAPDATPGTHRLWIDGKLYIDDETTSGALEDGKWSGGDAGGWLRANSTQSGGYSSNAWPVTTGSSGLRHYFGELVSSSVYGSSTTEVNLDRAVNLSSGNTFKLSVMYPEGGAYLTDTEATINNDPDNASNTANFSRGDLITHAKVDGTVVKITNSTQAQNAVDSSGNKIELVWNPNSRVETQTISTTGASVSQVTVSSEFTSPPSPDFMWAIREYDTDGTLVSGSAQQYVITEIKEEDTMSYGITAAKYEASKFDLVDRGYVLDVGVDTNKLPSYDELTPAPSTLSLNLVKSFNTGLNDETDNPGVSNKIRINWGTVLNSDGTQYQHLSHFEIKHNIDSLKLNKFKRVTAPKDETTMAIPFDGAGTYIVQIQAVNVNGGKSSIVQRKIEVTAKALTYDGPIITKIPRKGRIDHHIQCSTSTLSVATKQYKVENSEGTVFSNPSNGNTASYQQDFTGMSSGDEAYLLFDASESATSGDRLKAVKVVEDTTAAIPVGVDENSVAQTITPGFTYLAEVGASNNGITAGTGTISGSEGDTIITGSSTTFTSDFENGDRIVIDGAGATRFYSTINYIESDTKLQISESLPRDYSGVSVNTLSFKGDPVSDVILAKVSYDGSTYSIDENYAEGTESLGYFHYENASNTNALSADAFKTQFGRFPAEGDILIVVNTSTTPKQSKAYKFDSSPSTNDFVEMANFITGDLVVDGSISGTKINSATKVTAGTGDTVGVLDGADSTYRIYAGNATPGNAPFRVTQQGALTATSADITGDIFTDNLVVDGDANIHGTITATALKAGTVTIASIQQEVWNEIDARTAPAQDGFYDEFSSTGTDGYYVGVAKNFDLLGPSNNGYQVNTQKISFRSGMVSGFAQQGSQQYTGTALEATFQYYYKLASDSTWTSYGSAYVGTTDAYSITGGIFYELDADPDAHITAGTLTNGSYYHFRLAVTPTVTNNVWADDDADPGFKVRYDVQQSSTGTGTGTGTVTSVASGDGLSGGPITGSGTLTVDSTVVRTTGTQTIGGDKTFSDDIIISGNLDVRGTTTTLDTATLNVEDNNITLNYHASNDTSATANGAGITIQDAVNSTTDATILWDTTNDEFDFSHPINVSGTITSSDNLTITGSDKQIRFTGTTGPFGLEFGDTENNPNFRLYYRTTPNTLTFENNGGNAKHTFDLSGNYTSVGSVNVGTSIEMNGGVDNSINFAGTGSDTAQRKILYEASGHHYVTNRHGGGDLVLMSNNGTNAGETTRITLKAGSGTQDIDITNANLDMNSNNINNVGNIATTTFSVNGDITLTEDDKIKTSESSGGSHLLLRSDNLGVTGNSLSLIGLNDILIGSKSNQTGTGNIYFGYNAENKASGSGWVDTLTIADSGNIGIGASSPTDKLQILDSGNLALRVESTGTTNQSSVWTENNAGSINGMFMYGSSHSGYGAIAAGEGAFYSNTNVNIMSDSSSGVIKFSTGSSGGSERMRIDSSGKLLIGDSASHTDDLLQIETPASGGGHGIQIRRNDSNTDQGIGRIMFGNNTDTDLASIYVKTDGSTDNAAMTFNTQPNGGSSTERMRITSTGNIGIGDSNPPSNTKVAIQADGIGIRLDGTANTTRSIFFRNTTSSNPAEVYADGSLRLRTEDAGTSIQFQTNDTTALTLDSSQNATFAGTIDSGAITCGGIHTSAGLTFGQPDHFLGDEGGQNDSETLLLRNGASASGNSGIKILAGYNDGEDTSGKIQLYTNGSTLSPKLEIDIDGNIKMGSTQIISSGRNLTNIGTITSANIDVTGASGGNGQITVARTSGATVATQAQAARGLIGTSSNHPFRLISNGTQHIELDTSGNFNLLNNGEVRFSEATANGTNYVAIKSASSLGVDTTYTLPSTYPANSGAVLISTDAGVLSWSSNTVSTYSNGADNRVITATGASGITGETNLTYDGTTLGVVNDSAVVEIGNSTTPDPVIRFKTSSSGTPTIYFNDGTDQAYIRYGHSSLNGERLIISSTTTQFDGDIAMLDNKKVVFGTGSDFDAYYNGTNLRIEGTGSFQVGASTGFIISTGYGIGAATYMEGDYTNGVKLMQGGSTKLQTVSGGVNVTGTLNATGDVVAYYSSDERLKDNITVIDSALNKVTQIRGVEFDWNNKQNTYEGHDIGVIAQEVEKVVPELVKDRDDGYKAVDYQKLTALLIEAVKELKEEVEELKSKLQQ